jgi:hypothetical protein
MKKVSIICWKGNAGNKRRILVVILTVFIPGNKRVGFFAF